MISETGSAGSPLRLSVVLACCVLAGSLLGSLVWPWVVVPLRETYGMTFEVTENLNPKTNVLRTGIFALLPSFLLVFLYCRCARIRACVNDASLWKRRVNTCNSLPENPPGLALILAFTLILAINLWGSKRPALDPYHDGETLVAGISHINNQIPYRDYIIVHGLMQDALPSAVALRTFGWSLGGLRAVEHLGNAIVLVLIATFLYQVFSGRLVYVLLSVLAVAGLIGCSAIPGRTWFPLSPIILQVREIPTLLFLNMAALAAMRIRVTFGADSRMISLGFAGGALTPLSFLVSVDRGIFLSGAVFVFLLMLISAASPTVADATKLIAAAGTGLAVGSAAVWAVLHGGLSAFLWYMTVYLGKYKPLIDAVEYPLWTPAFLATLAMVATVLCVQTCMTLTFFANVPAGLAAAWRAYCRERLLEVTLTVTAVLWFGTTWIQADTWHLRLASLPLYLCVFHLLFRYTGWGQQLRTKQRQRRAAIAMLVLGVAGLLRIGASGLGRSWLPISVGDHEFVQPEVGAVTEYMKSVMTPHDELFAADSIAIWYYLLRKVSPTRWPIAYLAAPHECQREIVQVLESRKVRFVVTAAKPTPDARAELQSRKNLRILHGYIAQSYVPVTRISDRQIWMRKPLR